MAKHKIEITNSLTIYSEYNVTYGIVCNMEGDILEIVNIPMYIHKDLQSLDIVLQNVLDIIDKHSINTIILEQNKLFTDSVTKYPDPLVLQNILFNYKLNAVVEQAFHKKVKYIFELPNKEWCQVVLGQYGKYQIDRYIAHVLVSLYRSPIDMKNQIEQKPLNVLFKTYCLSESVIHKSLMNIKYWVNKLDEEK